MPPQSTLHKPKSKLRLRLGLTPPHPKPALGAIKLAPPLPSSLSPLRSAPITASTLTDSTSSVATGTSRPDSRSLFAYDSTSPSSQGNHVPTEVDLAFDTISYASTSPASVAFRATLPSPHANLYPTPSTSGYDTADADAEGEIELVDQGDGIDRPSLDEYPNIRSVIKASDDVFYIADQQLSDRFSFVAEVGFGNWGSVWLAKPRRPKSAYFSYNDLTPSQRAVRKLGKSAAASGGSGAGGKVAMKIVHRVEDSCTAARIRALWGEMKIVRSLRHEPHPSIIQFEAFCLTPSYAIVIMPYLSHLIQVCLPPKKATPYFRQLASAVGYLHERGITHNDIKPANVMISHNDIPVLVDFGFAHKWPLDVRSPFVSTISWGTPEYLDPYRAQGLPHDERASDVWSLGITFYEILIGRTPFEENEEEDFQEPNQYAIYLERSLQGDWLGEYHIPRDLIHLLENMLHVNPPSRMTAMQAYHHPSLHPAAPSVIVTPHFIREATSFDEYIEEPLPVLAPIGVPLGGEDKKRRKRKAAPKENQRSVTPALPLGESIKQHTSIPKSKRVREGLNDEESETPSPKKGGRLVIKKMRSQDLLGGDVGKDDDEEEEDITPTKIVKPAQPLKIQDAITNRDKKLISRPSKAQLRETSRPTSRTISKHDSVATLRTNTSISARSSKENLAPKSTKTLSHRTSNLSTLSSVSTVQNEDEARSRTLQLLEGVRVKKEGKRDVMAAISRPAPEPPVVVGRPKSADAALVVEGKKEKEVQRKSWAAERLLQEVITEEGEEVTVIEKEFELEVRVSSSSEVERINAEVQSPFHTISRSKQPAIMANIGSPPRKRMAKPAMPDSSPHSASAEGERSPAPRLMFGTGSPKAKNQISAGQKSSGSPGSKKVVKASVGEMMTNNDEKLGRFRQISADLSPAQFTPSTTGIKPDIAPLPISEPTPEISLQHRKSIEALALDNRLDKISEWVKTVESIVDEARKALAEGRELPLPLLTIPTPTTLAGLPTVPGAPTLEVEKKDTNLPTPRSRPVSDSVQEQTRMFGVSPQTSIPAHLRTSSVQVEPATPPKWMTYAEAEERVRKANSDWQLEEGKSRPVSGMFGIGDVGDVKRVSIKKERGSVASVLKLFAGAEKDKVGVRSSTPEPNMHIPLKPPAAPTLRATPSTPMLRSDSAATQSQRIPARKSESNLSRAFNTLPPSSHISFSDLLQQSAFSDDDEEDYGTLDRRGQKSHQQAQTPGSPRRLYERFLDSTPGVVRQGDGWSSGFAALPPTKPAMGKPSSMASLRERARMLIHGHSSPSSETFVHPHSIQPNPNNQGTTSSGRTIIDLANKERRNSQPLVHGDNRFGTVNSTTGVSFVSTVRPGTPGAGSVLTTGTGNGGKGWGIWKGLKSGLGMKKGKMQTGERMEELRA